VLYEIATFSGYVEGLVLYDAVSRYVEGLVLYEIAVVSGYAEGLVLYEAEGPNGVAYSFPLKICLSLT
jgi:hypothetical protein